MLHNEILGEHFFPHKEYIQFHVLGPIVQHRVMSKGNGTEVVTENCGSEKSAFKFLKERLHP